jgi:hypothetical protein
MSESSRSSLGVNNRAIDNKGRRPLVRNFVDGWNRKTTLTKGLPDRKIGKSYIRQL